MNKKTKAKLMPLIEEKATLEYFIEKMNLRLSKMWKQKQTKNRMYIYTRSQYLSFIDKIDELDETILNLTPPDTYYKDIPCVKIVD